MLGVRPIFLYDHFAFSGNVDSSFSPRFGLFLLWPSQASRNASQQSAPEASLGWGQGVPSCHFHLKVNFSLFTRYFQHSIRQRLLNLLIIVYKKVVWCHPLAAHYGRLCLTQSKRGTFILRAHPHCIIASWFQHVMQESRFSWSLLSQNLSNLYHWDPRFIFHLDIIRFLDGFSGVFLFQVEVCSGFFCFCNSVFLFW